MKSFTVTTNGPDRLGLVATCQRYVYEQWLADHATTEQAAAMMREQFRRAVELIEIKCAETSFSYLPFPRFNSAQSQMQRNYPIVEYAQERDRGSYSGPDGELAWS